MSTLLPIRPRPAPEEALDSYLERVATANGVTTSGFVRQLTTEARAPLRFTNIAPPPPILDVLASWTGTDRGLLQDCLLTRYPVIPFIDSQNRHGTRSVVAHGWVLLNRSQACPWCLAETGVWKITWRLAWVTACLDHDRLLATDCPGCQKPLRTTHHGALRPAGPGARCGNPRPQGQGKRCPFDLSRISPLSAPPPVLQQQRRVERALRGAEVEVAAIALEGTTYLRQLQALTSAAMGLSAPTTAVQPEYSEGVPAEISTLSGRARPAPRPADIRAAAYVRRDRTIFAPP
ncbi:MULTISPECIES: TniQ family protein [Micrococcus]|uniref:TniQ family protein n=1 Tax=Micrococcus TaxID=1269 RepID=UPI001C3107EC|nr:MULTISPECIES: TniQ family protein [Micrococcus]UBH25209.1 TniQ family protein [Micrococcus porci]